MKERKTSGNSILRAMFVAVSFLLQTLWILGRFLWWNAYSDWVAAITSVLSILLVLKLNSKHTTAAMKIPWIMLIMAAPVLGLSLYLMFMIMGDPGVGKRLKAVRREMQPELVQDPGVLEAMDLSDGNQSRYLLNTAGYPVYTNTEVTYYGEAVDAFAAMKQDLERAEHFIFMEYFIIADDSSFREVEEILVRKAGEGVEVRVMYDDIGSIGCVNMLFAKRLNQEGIHCRPFNPALPVLNLFLNHRDHRKMTIIDGKVGFTGGYNLADEYFGKTEPYGHWKDTGLRLEGEAVRSLTAIFLELWQIQFKEKETCGKYLDVRHSVSAAGFVQPFGDNPLVGDRVAEDVYLNLTAQASRTLYFITPYLIITDELTRALGLAAKRGVDVRIITPGIPDKKTVYRVTRSYYAGLARQGVRIFEYTPGFCHAKQCLCDGKLAAVGTSNLDFRSLYHHFENNVLLSGCEAIGDIQADFEALFPQCREVTDQYRTDQRTLRRIGQYILRLFAPLM